MNPDEYRILVETMAPGVLALALALLASELLGWKRLRKPLLWAWALASVLLATSIAGLAL